jgi:hypothetical protein
LDDRQGKFIERNTSILSELLPIVAPGCVRLDAMDFEGRFGFRSKEALVRFRLLDSAQAASHGYPFSDFAISLSNANAMRRTARTAIVVETDLTFLTLPTLPDSLAILGAGDAVSLLTRLEWLRGMRILYWGDLDSHGFECLSILRHAFPQTESLMMDAETLQQFKDYWVTGKPFRSRIRLDLNDAEMAVFRQLFEGDILLEQERIPLAYATTKLNHALLLTPII